MAAQRDANAEALAGHPHEPLPRRRGPRCMSSPHCRIPASYLARYGAPKGFWLHLAIGRSTTLVARHAVEDASQLSVGPARMPTWPDHATFVGHRLDLLCLLERPPFSAKELILPWASGAPRRVWVASQHAWKDARGPVCQWYPADSGLPVAGITYRFAGDHVTAAALAELTRGADLILGRSSRPGRRSRLEERTGLALAERGEQMHREHPSLTWEAIARRLNTTERSLRTYRADLARERLGVGQLRAFGDDAS